MKKEVKKYKSKIRVKDKVIVIAGRDKGKTGVVTRVFPNDNKLLVLNINLVKRHIKPSKDNQGGIISEERPIHISNVAFYDEDSKSYSKIGFRNDENGVKKRFNKRSGKILNELK